MKLFKWTVCVMCVCHHVALACWKPLLFILSFAQFKQKRIKWKRVRKRERKWLCFISSYYLYTFNQNRNDERSTKNYPLWIFLLLFVRNLNFPTRCMYARQICLLLFSFPHSHTRTLFLSRFVCVCVCVQLNHSRYKRCV